MYGNNGCLAGTSAAVHVLAAGSRAVHAGSLVIGLRSAGSGGSSLGSGLRSGSEGGIALGVCLGSHLSLPHGCLAGGRLVGGHGGAG